MFVKLRTCKLSSYLPLRTKALFQYDLPLLYLVSGRAALLFRTYWSLLSPLRNCYEEPVVVVNSVSLYLRRLNDRHMVGRWTECDAVGRSVTQLDEVGRSGTQWDEVGQSGTKWEDYICIVTMVLQGVDYSCWCSISALGQSTCTWILWY